MNGCQTQIPHKDPELRQGILRRFQQENPAIAQHLIENPELFDALLDEVSQEVDQNFNPMDEGDFEAIQIVSFQLFGYALEY